MVVSTLPNRRAGFKCNTLQNGQWLACLQPEAPMWKRAGALQALPGFAGLGTKPGFRWAQAPKKQSKTHSSIQFLSIFASFCILHWPFLHSARMFKIRSACQMVVFSLDIVVVHCELRSGITEQPHQMRPDTHQRRLKQIQRWLTFCYEC